MRKVEKGAIVKGKVGVIKKLTAGVIVELSGKKIGNYREVSKIVSGVEPKPEALGWIYKTTYSKIKHAEPEGKKAPKYLGKTVYKVKNTASDTETFAKDTKGVRGRIGVKGGEVLALYPRGCELELEAFAKGAKRAKVIKVVSGTAKYPAGKSDNGYVWLADLKAKVHPPTFEQVIIPAKPIPLKKGDKIGYMGQYCTPEMPKDRPMLHWEIFAGDNLKGFIGRSRDANATAKKSEKTILEVPKNTPLIWPHERPADTSIAKDKVIRIIKKQNDYMQCQTLGITAIVNRKTQLHYVGKKAGAATYTILKDAVSAVSTLFGETVTETTEVKLLIQHKGDDRTVLLPQTAEMLWIKKSTGLNKLDKDKQQLKISAHAWTKYPEEFTHEVTKTTERTCLKPSELKVKKLDENNNEWFEMSSYDNQMCSVGYINTSNLTRHAPEEFICFDGVDIKGGSDASIHKDPDNYWKNLFAPITLESSQHEEGSPVNDMRLDVHPFAKKVFQYIDANHDGTLTLQEMKSALSNPIKQKKIATLITKHESEWVKSMDRWKYIEKYIPDETRFDWEYEKKKIQKLAWWDEVKGKVTGFPKEEAYYFHPAGFVGNFVGGCCCNRDFTVAEVEEIVKKLRATENIKSLNIWAPQYKSGLSPSDKTYETMTDKLNSVMSKYNINTCIRKIHFLAQTYHETDRFRAMTEYTSKYTPRYDPYRGRGLVHLTHGPTYKKFAKYMGDDQIYKTPKIVGTNIDYAYEAGGWYWENIGKVTATNENINLVADKDNVLKVSQCINGRVARPNGLEARIKYTKSLKEILNYEDNH